MTRRTLLALTLLTLALADPPLPPPDPPVLPGSARARQIEEAYARFEGREPHHRGGPRGGAPNDSLGPRRGV